MNEWYFTGLHVSWSTGTRNVFSHLHVKVQSHFQNIDGWMISVEIVSGRTVWWCSLELKILKSALLLLIFSKWLFFFHSQMSTIKRSSFRFASQIETWVLFQCTCSVADIDDTRVIWIALLRHAGKTLVLPEVRTKIKTISTNININPINHGLWNRSDYTGGGVVFSPPPIYLENYTWFDNKNVYIYATNCFLSNSRIIFIKIYFNK